MAAAHWNRRGFLGSFGAALAVGPLLLAQDKDKSAKVKEGHTARPDTLFLTWFRDPTTTMAITWAAASSETEIRYRNRNTTEWTHAPAVKSKPFPVIELPKSAAKYKHFYNPEMREIAPPPKGPWLPTGPEDYKVYRVELTDLTPGTEYEFMLGASGEINRFRTMPAKQTREFSFISGGDCGVNAHAIANNRAAASQDPHFALICGDLGYDNGVNGEVALQFLRNYSSTMIDSHGRLIPMVVGIGNHEVRGSYNKTLNEATFFTPFFDGFFAENSYNVLDFGDYLSLVILDSGHAAPIKGAQTAWLDATLKARAGHPNLIVANHVPAYPSYRAAEGQGDKLGTGEEQRKHWVPVFDQHRVDVVLEHHDHTFKRTRPLRAGKIDEEKGIVYLGDGSWGRLRVANKAQKRSYLEDVNNDYHITLHRIEGEHRYHIALGESGKVMDIFHTSKKKKPNA